MIMKILSVGVLLWSLSSSATAFSVASSSLSTSTRQAWCRLAATVTPLIKDDVLQSWNTDDANDYAEQFGLSGAEATLYGLVQALRNSPMGLTGRPFVLRKEEIPHSLEGFFTMEHLEKALEEDFLDAARGSTDNRKGWKVCICILFDLFYPCTQVSVLSRLYSSALDHNCIQSPW